MVVMLFVVGVLYQRARDAKTWTWLVPESQREETSAAAPVPSPPDVETVTEGPTDLDDEQKAEAVKLLAAVTDFQKLADVEMPAYWRLLGWAQHQSFGDLSQRAQRDVPLTKLHEQPDKYRAQLLRLRLNVRRVLDFEAPQNSAGVRTVYEAWGWTNDSKARPYVVVFAELPPGMKPGTDVDYEVQFAGYFLKWMQYETYKGQKRSAPLLVGRLQSRPASAPLPRSSPWSLWDFAFFRWRSTDHCVWPEGGFSAESCSPSIAGRGSGRTVGDGVFQIRRRVA